MTQRAPSADHHSPERPVFADDALSIDSSLSSQSNGDIDDADQNNSERDLTLSTPSSPTPRNQSQFLPETPSPSPPISSLEMTNCSQSPREDRSHWVYHTKLGQILGGKLPIKVGVPVPLGNSPPLTHRQGAEE